MSRITAFAALCLLAGAGFAVAGCAAGNADRTASLTLPTRTVPTVTHVTTTTQTEMQTQTVVQTETRAAIVPTTVATTVMAVTTAPTQTVVVTVATPTTTSSSDTTHSTDTWGWIVAGILGIGLIVMVVVWFTRGKQKEAS